jgi:hypothetical protein
VRRPPDSWPASLLAQWQLTGEQPDVDNYDACYLPNGKIVFTSTACFQAVPCTGSDEIAVLYVMDPDGTEQMEYLGSNSYWPNALFYARPIPSHPTKVVAVISGHHGQPRMSELVMFDPARGRHEARPAVQRIPGYGKKVERAMKDQKDAIVYISDICAGKGLAGIPRGAVKSLRVLSYHFAYRGMVTNPNTIGVNGPWDIKRVLGTVPVCEDGSAKFRIPANTPLSLQPLDAEGKALQLMRNWMTAMPGEAVQCAGCHEQKKGTVPFCRSHKRGLSPFLPVRRTSPLSQRERGPSDALSGLPLNRTRTCERR